MLLAWWICQNEDLRSAVVVGLLHFYLKNLPHQGWLNFWLTVRTGISDPELVFGFHSSPPLRSELVLIYENSMDSIPMDKVLKKTRLDLQKRFPIYHVSQLLGGPSLRLGIPIERLSNPPGTGWGGKNTGWLVTWECPLRTESASWKSLESFIQLISFCNSCILPVSSRIVTRSSTIFFSQLCRMLNLETASILPFHLGFSHELHGDPKFASITAHEEHDKFLLFVTRSFHSTFEYFFCRNRPGIRVFESLLDSQRESALFVAPRES